MKLAKTNYKQILQIIIGVFGKALVILIVIVGLAGVYLVGYLRGYGVATTVAESEIISFMDKISLTDISPTPSPFTGALSPKTENQNWGGPDLWKAVNDKRKEYGVNGMTSKSELCTIAAIRLNDLLTLGSLDGHEGFSNMPEDRPDLKWIFEKYNMSEFLLSGATSPDHAVSLWENTLGHKKLLNGGEYVWGCIYAQNGVAVAIAAY